MPQSLEGEITKPMTAILAAGVLRGNISFDNHDHGVSFDHHYFVSSVLKALQKQIESQKLETSPVYTALAAYQRQKNAITEAGGGGSLGSAKKSPEVGF